MAKPIGTLGTIDSLTIAGRTFTNLSGLIIVYGSILTTSHSATFRKANGASGYTPSGSLAFKGYALRLSPSTVASTGGSYSLAQSDNDVGLDSATSLTNPVYIAGSANAFAIAPPQTLAALPIDFAIDIPVLNGKYLTLNDSGGVGRIDAIVYGYEA